MCIVSNIPTPIEIGEEMAFLKASHFLDKKTLSHMCRQEHWREKINNVI